jgi:hypothetical protein
MNKVKIISTSAGVLAVGVSLTLCACSSNDTVVVHQVPAAPSQIAAPPPTVAHDIAVQTGSAASNGTQAPGVAH